MYKFFILLVLVYLFCLPSVYASRKTNFSFHYGTWGSTAAPIAGWCSIYVTNISKIPQNLKVFLVLKSLGGFKALEEARNTEKTDPTLAPSLTCVTPTLSSNFDITDILLNPGCTAVLYRNFGTGTGADGLPLCYGSIEVAEDRGAIVSGLMRYEVPNSQYSGGSQLVNGGRPF